MANDISSLPSLAIAEKMFLKEYPQYQSTSVLDGLRKTDYARLDRLGHVYLDYTGGGLYAEAQVQAHADQLLHNVFGNPHSTNPTSLEMTQLIQRTRQAVLDYFHANPEEYVVIFTCNASGALKLVGESYPFTPGGNFLLIFDNHNSVNGIREFARAKGARVTYAPVIPPDMYIDEGKLDACMDLAQSGDNLFAYPAQSNFSGVQHDLGWIERAHAKGWDVLLDAAAFVPTNPLDLSRWRPDYVVLSFYKMFGYPTGVGVLLARKAALMKLHRPWFAGGTITVASVQGNRYYLSDPPEAFEDGTLNYLSLPAVEIGLRHIERIGIEKIHARVRDLTSWLLKTLSAMQHSNGTSLIKIYGPLAWERRGGTITMNFYGPDGHFIDHRIIEDCANHAKISLRTGCFCNPGGGELALGIPAEELNSCFLQHVQRMTFDDFRRCIDDHSTGAVRVSCGMVTNFSDVYHFARFAQGFLDKSIEDILAGLSSQPGLSKARQKCGAGAV
jgi:molybdenum cofactor sulfurtransferase